MTAKETSEPDPATGIITLNPLRTDGPAALDTHDVPEIQAASLIELETVSEDPFHQATIKKAHDIFQASLAAASEEPISVVFQTRMFASLLLESNSQKTVT
jgi:hypothetical protein